MLIRLTIFCRIRRVSGIIRIQAHSQGPSRKRARYSLDIARISLSQVDRFLALSPGMMSSLDYDDEGDSQSDAFEEASVSIEAAKVFALPPMSLRNLIFQV